MLLSRREVVAARDLKTEARVVMVLPRSIEKRQHAARGRCGAAACW